MTLKQKIIMHAAGLAVATAVLFTVPVSICGLGASKWLDSDLETELKLANGVADLLFSEAVSQESFHTSSSQFNGEWLFGSYLMAGIGFSQIAMEYPKQRKEQAVLTKKCIEKLLTEEVRAFDVAVWGKDPIDDIGSDNSHVAYLGYFNLLLGMYRLTSDDHSYDDLNDRITAAFINQLKKSKTGLLESYPDEIYPVDNCFMIGSIGLNQRVTGKDHHVTVERWIDNARDRYIDPKSKLLIQAVDPSDGSPADEPRGSGTALGIVAVHYADPQFAHELYQGIKTTLARHWLGFGTVREYPVGCPGDGDIDSGPIIFGYGLSATGFTIAGAKRYNDKSFFRRLLATAHLSGAPISRNGKCEYVSGGPLGNAILFAMLTVPQVENFNKGADQ